MCNIVKIKYVHVLLLVAHSCVVSWELVTVTVILGNTLFVRYFQIHCCVQI